MKNIRKNILKKYNFSYEYKCRWCGSNFHMTDRCILN